MVLNSDLKVVMAITNRLKVTNGYCPCTPQEEWSEDWKCPCKAMREQDTCHCGLFVKEGV